MRKPMTPSSIDGAIAHRGSLRRQTGLTLVEIMVSLTLGLIVLLAVGSVYIGSRQTYRVQEDNARIQEAGKYALEILGRSIRQAGADQEMNFTAQDGSFTCPQHSPVALPLEPACVAVDNNGAAGATDTIRNQFYAGRDELIGGVWGARNCLGGVIPANTLITNIFSLIGTDLSCSTGAGVAAQPLISDVEDMQVLYGIDTSGDQSADQYVATPGNWAQVVTARVCVQVRSTNDGLATAPQTYLNCEGALGNPTVGAPTTTLAGDLRLHRSFVATYNLRNRVNGAP